MPCRTMCTVCGFAALSHSYFIRLYLLSGWDSSGLDNGSSVMVRAASGTALGKILGNATILPALSVS
ncbi:hypothetical protein D0T90_06085 [Neisseria animalis]|uniref:Uncharacterized protein n=1 Tax=Neisseria animalis TaxID=492 RepID=A0A5P3MR97_NEIAN|nr:hypothetical protein D0T90_06085 [Neisseria animalis]ROW32680.1 hypothetical protein CGZ60_04425 [Neisseria animalis]